MKKIALLSIIIISTFLFGGVFGQVFGQIAQEPKFIEVTGRAEREVTPDEIYMNIIIKEADFKNKTLSILEAEMIKELKKIGIDTEKDLSVSDLLSNFKHRFILKSDVQLQKSYQLLVREAKVAGKVIVNLQKIGISSVSVVRVDNSKIEEYKKELLVEAIKAAKVKAQLLTEAIGQKLYSAIYIREQEVYGAPFMSNMVMRSASMDVMSEGAVPESNIEFEATTIKASVVVRFGL